MKVSVKRPGGSWIEQNYDKLALSTALLAMLISGLVLISRVETQRQGIREQINREAGQVAREAQPLDDTLVTSLIRNLSKPYQAMAEAKRFLVGELRVASIPDGAPIPFAATQDPFTGREQPKIEVDPDSDGDGIPDKHEVALSMNPFDPADAMADTDGDAYSNLEEFLAQTDPKDAASFPPSVAKLRLIRTVTDPFRFIFAGISGERFQLNTRGSERTYFVSIGDEVEGFRVASYETNAPAGPTLVLQRGGQSFRLVRGRQITDEARTAFMILLLDGSRYRVRVNDTLTLRETRYKVIDIREDRVVLREEQTDKTATVTLISPEERERLMGTPLEGSPSPALGP